MRVPAATLSFCLFLCCAQEPSGLDVPPSAADAPTTPLEEPPAQTSAIWLRESSPDVRIITDATPDVTRYDVPTQWWRSVGISAPGFVLSIWGPRDAIAAPIGMPFPKCDEPIKCEPVGVPRVYLQDATNSRDCWLDSGTVSITREGIHVDATGCGLTLTATLNM
jgi:hypothetical protein